MTKKDVNVLQGGVFEVDQSNRVEELAKDSYVGVARGKFAFVVKLAKKEKRLLFVSFEDRGRKKLFGPEVFCKLIVLILKLNLLIPARLVVDLEYPGYEDLIVRIIKTYEPGIEVVFKQIGKNSEAHKAVYVWGSAKNRLKLQNKKSTVVPIYGTAADLHPEFTGIRNRTRSR